MTGPAGIERVEDEGEVAAAEAGSGRPGPRLAAHNHQPAGHGVDAVAVLAPGGGVEGMLEQPAGVSEPFGGIEHRLANTAPGGPPAGGHSAPLPLTSRPATSRYWLGAAAHP